MYKELELPSADVYVYEVVFDNQSTYRSSAFTDSRTIMEVIHHLVNAGLCGGRSFQELFLEVRNAGQLVERYRVTAQKSPTT